MTYREFTLLFIKFLKERNALENYKQNCIARIKQGYKRRKNPMYQILNPLLMEEIEEQVERIDIGERWLVNGMKLQKI